MRNLVGLIAALTLLVSACGSDTAEQSGEPSPSTTTTAAEDAAIESTAVDDTEVDGTEVDDGSADSETELFPDVVDAVATQDDDGTWTFAVTLSSPYDSPERYADSWRVRGEDGTVYGERFLTHDHANEQPFTRSQSNIEVPESIVRVVIEGRDQVSGWGGGTLTIELDR